MERGGETREEKGRVGGKERGRQSRAEGRRRAQTQLHTPQVLLMTCFSLCDPQIPKPVLPPTEMGAQPDPDASLQFPFIHIINCFISSSCFSL